jgi:cation transport ATPase
LSGWGWGAAALAILSGVVAAVALGTGRTGQGILFAGQAVVLSSIVWSFSRSREENRPTPSSRTRVAARMVMAMAAVAVIVALWALMKADWALATAMGVLVISWMVVGLALDRSDRRV